MFCPYCGKEIKDDSVFCALCGKKINNTSTSDDDIKSRGNTNWGINTSIIKERILQVAVKTAAKTSAVLESASEKLNEFGNTIETKNPENVDQSDSSTEYTPVELETNISKDRIKSVLEADEIPIICHSGTIMTALPRLPGSIVLTNKRFIWESSVLKTVNGYNFITLTGKEYLSIPISGINELNTYAIPMAAGLSFMVSDNEAKIEHKFQVNGKNPKGVSNKIIELIKQYQIEV